MNTPCRVSFLLQRFFTERLMNQRNVSPHTIACYRDTFRLLLEFIHRQKHRVPSQLTSGRLRCTVNRGLSRSL